MAKTINEALVGNTYPGRGIVIGRSEDNEHAVIAYFIMGRSENSRNRVFEETEDGIRTKAFDEDKLTDPSLVIYHPVRMYSDYTIVTNGDQTDTIRDFLQSGRTFYSAVKIRTFEPDPPIWTPRISGMLDADGTYRLAIVKNVSEGGETPLHCIYEYTQPVAGTGHFIRTYQENGNPPQSFAGEPVEVAIDISDGIEAFANRVWDALDAENRVSLYVRTIELETGSFTGHIINKHGGVI